MDDKELKITIPNTPQAIELLKDTVPITRSKARSPLDAMKDMRGMEDISRHERAEEAIRENFRNLFSKIRYKNIVDKSV
ncbi:hypothetical protein K8I28_01515 [bacterium]|nr:hypothetical protein [bacterium]